MTDDLKAQELLPCPFCGGRLRYESTTGYYRHLVAKCVLSGRSFPKGYIGRWNRRAALSDHPTVKQMVADAEARGMERAAEICAGIRTRIANGPMPEGARFDYEQDIRAEAALTRIARLGQGWDAAKPPTEYERKAAQMKEDFPNGI